MSNITSSDNSERESFQQFFESWLVQQNRDLQDLIFASTNHKNTNTNHSKTEATPIADGQVSQMANGKVSKQLINQVIEHYEHYYKTKSRCVKQDVLAMLSPTWTTSLEDAFLWIGGWRPSMAFHLLYSKSGLEFEVRFNEIIHGLHSFDLADLSLNQITKLDELQTKTIREEREITEKMAKQQETVADSSMVELSHLMTEMIRDAGTGRNDSNGFEDRVDSTLAPKEDELEKILLRADDLRLRTLKSILNILNPLQAAQFLIAAAELHLRLHDWGKKRDARYDNRGISSLSNGGHATVDQYGECNS
ncbi:Transcription factor TGA5 [Quillaja saponaria]|uniref:Transcription factor TGA5 n=1 Tax=Quillaja saponaria TaxID=32244 RepID=A0AAD7PIP5_QUISA|nr:Transcription factor TGA5 [Quillaja saponaria]